MIQDGKPAHWPKMLAAPPAVNDEQAAIRALARVRRLVVDYHKSGNSDWRVDHARTDYIVNVVAGLLADVKAMDRLYDKADKARGPLLDKIDSLTEQLAESKRPFSAQMEMQNRRITALNAAIERLMLALEDATRKASA